MRPCYSFITASANKPPTLSIFDEIGFWGMQAKEFLAALATVDGPVLDVEISSPGGDALAAVAMYNGLRASGKEITTRVLGVAASAASLIFMAGDKRVMPKNTHLMVHNPSTWGGGTAEDHQNMADMLTKVGATIRGTYVSRSGMTDEEAIALLSKDTWLTADEALANGLATEVVDEIRATVSFDMERADLPAAVRAVYMSARQESSDPPAEPPTDLVDPPADPVDPPAEPVEQPVAFANSVQASAKDAGFEAHAATWALACTSMTEVTARIATAREITALCDVTKMADMAAGMIAANKTVADARATLTEKLAKLDEETHVDTTMRHEQTQSTSTCAKPKVSTASLWALHNSQSKK